MRALVIFLGAALSVIALTQGFGIDASLFWWVVLIVGATLFVVALTDDESDD